MTIDNQVEVLLTELEDCVVKAHPFLTTNVGRKDITQVVALVRELQLENQTLKQALSTKENSNDVSSNSREVDKDSW